MELDLDITYVFAIALFLLPLILLNFLVFRPFLQVFEERHDRLEGAIERADEMLAEAERKAGEFEAQIRAATQQGLERRNQIRAQATHAMNRRIEEERARVNGRLKDALTDLETTRNQALGEVKAKAEALADQMASKLLGRRFT
ncbi:MAG: ATP synthase F0 subunit B [Myxococcota bacterium]